LFNFLSFLWYAFWRVPRLPKPDVVVCETAPFLLPFLAIWVRFRKRCKLVFYLQDIYPDIAIAVGKAKNGFLIRLLRGLLRWCYRRADCIVVLSEDMKQTISGWGTLDAVPIHIIPNWIDTTKVVPVKEENPWRVENKFASENMFLVMYSGNLGLSQDLSIVIDAAKQLQDLDELHFVFVGEGASREALIEQAEGLENVTFLPYQPRERLAESLSAADLHLLPIRKEALGCLMPSKLYGILASGTAVLSIAPETSELARIVVEHRVGINLPRFESDQIERVLRDLAADRHSWQESGIRGRQLAETKYDRKVSVGLFKNLLTILSNR
jgi:colanic acid biosynthesis glycosyl transferase WcaI